MKADRVWLAVLAVCALAAAAPLWSVRILPFSDLPEQVAVIGTLRHWADPAWSGPYTFEIGQSQYVLYHLIGAALAVPLGSAELANRVLLSLVAVAIPFTMRGLLRALGRDERLALLSVPTFWSRPLMMGFLPYVASAPLVIGGIALTIRQLDAPTRRRAIALGTVAVALFFVHVDGFLLFGVAVVALRALRLLEDGQRTWRSAVRDLAWLAPAAIGAIAWSVFGSLSAPEKHNVIYIPVKATVQSLPVWTYDIFTSHVDEACSIVLWSAFTILLIQRGERSTRSAAMKAIVPFAIAVLFYVALPFSVGAAGMVNVRNALFIGIFAPLVLPRLAGLRRALPLAAVIASNLVLAGDVAYELRKMERTEVGDLDRIIDRIPLGASLVTLPFHFSSATIHQSPWPFVGGYHRARAGGLASFSFSEIPHWPLHYRRGVFEPNHPFFWTFNACSFRNEVDGPQYDYVLTRGTIDPFRDAPPGPKFRRVMTEKEWTLYERVKDETNPPWVVADLGPCESRSSLELKASLEGRL